MRLPAHLARRDDLLLRQRDAMLADLDRGDDPLRKGRRPLGYRRDGSPIWQVGGGARGLYVCDMLPPVYTVSRAAFNTFTSFADVCGAPQTMLPKSRMEVGLILELWAAGKYSSTGTPTASGGFYFNGGASTAATTLVAPTTILGQSQLAATGGTTVTAGPFHAYLRAVLRANAAGASGGSWYVSAGFFKVASSTTPFNTLVEWNVPVTDALRTVTCDVTADRAVGFGWQWGTSSSSNAVTVDEFEARCIT
jgi:hypothetical protein